MLETCPRKVYKIFFFLHSTWANYPSFSVKKIHALQSLKKSARFLRELGNETHILPFANFSIKNTKKQGTFSVWFTTTIDMTNLVFFFISVFEIHRPVTKKGKIDRALSLKLETYFFHALMDKCYKEAYKYVYS